MNNLKSSRVDFASFKSDKEFKKSKYFEYLSKPIMPKSVLIAAEEYTPRVQEVVDALQKAGVTIYASKTIEKELKGKIVFIKRRSRWYYLALAMCKYIVVFDELWGGCIKRDKQILVSAIPNLDDAEKRVQHDVITSKADYYLEAVEGKEVLNLDELVLGVKKSTLKPQELELSNKKKVLFSIDNHKPRLSVALVESIISWLDLDKFEVSVFVTDEFYRDNADIILDLRKEVKIFMRSGALYRDEKVEQRIQFLSEEMYYINDIKALNSFIPDYVFENELKRVFGKQKFDVAINLGQNYFYNYFLMNKAAKERFCLDLTDYCYATMKDDLDGRARLASNYDAVYYLTKDCMEEAISLCPALEKKAKLLGMMPFTNRDSNDKTIIETNDGPKMVVKLRPLFDFDTMNLTMFDYYEEGKMSYFITDGTKTAQENVDMIDNIAKHTKDFIVFDMYNVIPYNQREKLENAYNTKIYVEFVMYGVVMEQLKDCYAFTNGDIGIAYHAKDNKKNIICLDSDGKEAPRTASTSFVPVF